LTGGRRTALPRHQTLRATLDWSHQLLPELERVVLRRLAIFAGGFTLQAATTVAATDEIGGLDIVDCAANLVAKSLVTADLGGATEWYRLLETTRAYALEKLTQSGEFEQLARRHAEYCRDLFERAEAELQTCSAAEWLAAYGRRIDNLRAARIASPEMFPEAEMLPHLICSRPMFIGGAKDEADQHGGA
jgi:predicted ATPase